MYFINVVWTVNFTGGTTNSYKHKYNKYGEKNWSTQMAYDIYNENYTQLQ